MKLRNVGAGGNDFVSGLVLEQKELVAIHEMASRLAHLPVTVRPSLSSSSTAGAHTQLVTAEVDLRRQPN